MGKWLGAQHSKTLSVTLKNRGTLLKSYHDLLNGIQVHRLHVKEYINSTVSMGLYLDKDLKLACGRGLHLVKRCGVMEGGLPESCNQLWEV